MIISLLAEASTQSWNPFAPFGVTSWEPFLANLIAFLIMVAVLRIFAFKPIQKMLENRRERIIEGEQMRAESEQQLIDVQKTAKEMLAKAGQDGLRQIEEAKQAAARLLESKEAEATKLAHDMMEKSMESAELEAKKARNELKSEFGKLVAMATSQVAGKVLTPDDHQRINSDVINSL
ncbi:MAG: ATP synthase F0 subunit B [Akkermansia sp.]